MNGIQYANDKSEEIGALVESIESGGDEFSPGVLLTMVADAFDAGLAEGQHQTVEMVVKTRWRRA